MPDYSREYVIDAESIAEMVRLQKQAQIITRGMGGILTEQSTSALEKMQDILDIACGPGEWCFQVSERFPGKRITGLDKSTMMIEYANAQAKAHGFHRCTFVVMDATEPLTFPGASFDLVNARLIGGFMPTLKWLPLLAEMKRILRPGGMVRLTEGEVGYVVGSMAMSTLEDLLIKSLYAAGKAFSDRGSQGITVMLRAMLQQAGFQDIRRAPYIIENSHDLEGFDAVIENFLMIYRNSKPFILKYNDISEHQYDILVDDIEREAQSGHVYSIRYLLTAWGTKSPE